MEQVTTVGILWVGLDAHSKSISVAAMIDWRSEVAEWEIQNSEASVVRLAKRLRKMAGSGEIRCCYEAGPLGFTLQRQLEERREGIVCEVIAPSLIPRRPGDRVKTDRRDALKLARLLRSGDLRCVWVPGKEQEAMRDLSRCRADFKIQEKKAKLQLNAFVLRHRHHWPRGKSRWTKSHFAWLEDLKFAHPWQQEVLQEYIDAVQSASSRVAAVTKSLMNAIPEWSLAPVVDSLIALRGVDRITAVTLLAELGDISRFDSPKQLMGFLGLVPNLRQSGSSRRSGSITLAGNSHARRALVESAWCYRFPARKTKHLQRKEANASDAAKAIAWRAQQRLCGRYRALMQAGKNSKVTCIAIARELVGFVWDIVRHEIPKATPA